MFTIRSYSELITIPTWEERVNYLLLSNEVSEETFGPYRYLNQDFYRSKKWKVFRQKIIIRDDGCDLGLYGYDIRKCGDLVIHHINPITLSNMEDLDILLNPDNVICCTRKTHNLIHYGRKASIKKMAPIERKPNDHILW